METAKSKLTVLFDPPFWVGVFERESGGRYEACKLTFGAEPRDAEVWACVLARYDRLDFSPALAVQRAPDRTVSPKRAQRLARRLQREQQKTQRQRLSRQNREAEEERRYLLRREKRREKRRGR